MKDKFVIIDIINGDFMKDSDGKINIYNSEYEAEVVCGMYEFENVWICKLIHNHIE